jgi:hypothetical protein
MNKTRTREGLLRKRFLSRALEGQPSDKVFPDTGWEISINVIQKRPDSLKCRSDVIYVPVQDVGVLLGSSPGGEEIVP